jgi:uncharacterized protein (DUF58 family)
VLPERTFEGDTVTARVVLRNTARIPVFFPRASEFFPPEIHALKTAFFPYRVAPGESAEESYTASIIAPRGIYRFGALRLQLSDPLGWFRTTKVVGGEAQLKVYPRFDRLGARERIGSSLALLSSRAARRGLGESLEFLSVREYRRGDPLRRIHWPLTAHRGYPVVREYTRNSTGDLCVFIDLYRYALLGLGRGSSLEHAVKITAGLCAQALYRGYRAQVLARGKTDFRVPSSGGKAHLGVILDALILMRPDGEVPLDAYLEEARREVRPGAVTLVMTSPYLRRSRSFETGLTAMRRSGGRVILAIFDDSTFHSLYEPAAREDPAARYARRMAGLGMETIIVPCAASLPALFGAPEAA